VSDIQKSETCAHCRAVIPAGAVQQGQLIDDDWYPLHVGCADAWATEEIPVWTIEHEDYGYTTGSASMAEGEAAELEDGQSITVTRGKMQRLKYLTLPECEP